MSASQAPSVSFPNPTGTLADGAFSLPKGGHTVAVAEARGTQGNPGATATPDPAVQSDSLVDILTDAFVSESQGEEEPEDEILDDDLPEDEEASEEPDEEEDAAAASATDSQEDPKLTRWADALRQNPKRLTQIPNEQRVAAIDLALKRTVEATVAEWQGEAEKHIPNLIQQAYEKGFNEGSTQGRDAATFRELEALEEEDPQAFLEITRNDPAKARRFYEWKETGKVEQETGVNAELRREVDAMKASLTPEATAILRENAQKNPGIYRFDAAGSARFLRDAQAALHQSANEKTRKELEARAEAERRKKAAEARKKLPKPESDDRTGKPPVSGGSVTDLITAGWGFGKK